MGYICNIFRLVVLIHTMLASEILDELIDITIYISLLSGRKIKTSVVSGEILPPVSYRIHIQLHITFTFAEVNWMHGFTNKRIWRNICMHLFISTPC